MQLWVKEYSPHLGCKLQSTCKWRQKYPASVCRAQNNHAHSSILNSSLRGLQLLVTHVERWLEQLSSTIPKRTPRCLPGRELPLRKGQSASPSLQRAGSCKPGVLSRGALKHPTLPLGRLVAPRLAIVGVLERTVTSKRVCPRNEPERVQT
mmetsp:Transcript_11045/g.25950  ORF Transcript_11045/g.25950 Transcript_11045/m.25950 type:complete len:151 (-) Transcript_11045:1372-1824(-)